jgi:hypothetical protein
VLLSFHPPSPSRCVVAQCTLNWTFSSKWVVIACMPILALVCTIIVAIIVTLKNFLLEKWEDHRGKPLSPPTEIDALYGLLFASFYYLYLQVSTACLLQGVGEGGGCRGCQCRMLWG